MAKHTDQKEFFARCASGFEDVLADELRDLGCQRVRPLKGGVEFFGEYADGLRACLWSRVATRVQLVLARVSARDADTLYAGVRKFPWEKRIAPGVTVAMQAHGTNSALRNTQFTALKVKDAVCDRLLEERGARPDVDGSDPDFCIDISIFRDRATLFLNLAGPVLHKRGYRQPGVQTEAPLKETLAAGMLLAAGWDDIATDGMGLADPMCGSGTLAIEAALIATNTAPGLMRDRWGFESYLLHDADLWQQLLAEAEDVRVPTWETGIRILAGDLSAEAIEVARANAERAGVDDMIEFFVDDAANLGRHMKHGRPLHGGLAVCNPPYGYRLLSGDDLPAVYAALSSAVAKLGDGWKLATITPDAGIDSGLGRVPVEALPCHNGPLSTSLRIYDLSEASASITVTSLAGTNLNVTVAERGSDQFAARLRKVAKERGKWARKSGVKSYRIYDADLPDYAFSVDLFCKAEDGSVLARVEEHRAGSDVDADRANRRFFDALAIIPAVLDIDREQVFFKRARQEKGAPTSATCWTDIREGEFVFEVDLGSQNACGLPLDMRPVREMLRKEAEGKRVACLLAHGGAPTTYAAAGNAASTVTVDSAKIFLDQAERIVRANGFKGSEHSFVCEDALEWVAAEAEAGTEYDLVYCDLSAFPASKEHNVVDEHMPVIQAVAQILAPDGKLLLSCSAKGFKLSDEAFGGHGLRAQDVTANTIGHDFSRTPKIHRTFLIGRE